MFLRDNSVFVPVRDPNLSPEKTPMPSQPAEARVENFDEVALGYTPELAREEASRCLKCPGRYCSETCPAHVPTTEFIARVRAGDYQGAYELIAQKNALPAITGRVCAQERQCELNCTRGIRGESVSIGRLEAFVADWHAENGAPLPCAAPKDVPVAVVGSGPAGLACADDLSRAGFQVTLYEARDFLGGIPVYGIPGFVLPNAVVDRKLDELRTRGVRFLTGVKVGADVSVAELCDTYKAVFVATGAGKPVMPQVPGQELPGVYTANDYLTAANVAHEPVAGKRVLVLGGGNTAIDAARCARRAGAESVTIVYRRSEAEMPARREEVRHALEEGIQLCLMAAPAAFLEADGKLAGLRCRKTAFTDPDYPGGRRNIRVTEEEFDLAADTAVLALGFTAEPIEGLKTNDKGLIVVDRNTLAASREGTYAGGDAVTGANTLVHAMADGKKAAALIIEKLS